MAPFTLSLTHATASSFKAALPLLCLRPSLRDAALPGFHKGIWLQHAEHVRPCLGMVPSCHLAPLPVSQEVPSILFWENHPV